MVWGMPLPPGPYGAYEGLVDAYGDGWRHRLRKYYDEQMPAEQKALHEGSYGGASHSYPFFAMRKFVDEPGTPDGPDRLPLTPIEEHEPPRSFQLQKGHKSPASMISLPSRILAVSEPLKGFIEWLDPGVHQFFPIEIGNTRGPVYEVPYHVFVVGRHLDCFLPEKSAKVLFRTDGPTPWWSSPSSKNEVMGLALERSKFDGAHVWRERTFRENLICFSDQLMAEISDAGLKMPHRWRMKEV